VTRKLQQRRLDTRARLLEVASQIVSTQGYGALRVEDVSLQAGTAKGTLFTHFKDKDGLLGVIIGKHVESYLDDLAELPHPGDVAELCDLLAPLMTYVAQDRIIFDLLLRYSGATGLETEDTITQFFLRQAAILTGWLGQMQSKGQVRTDHPPEILAEGVQAFESHVLGLWFCTDHAADGSPADALEQFLQAWLVLPVSGE